ncbi:ABC transporter permease [Nocardioides litoris]|uniref:ABC transporter permease n=1 Tax=Nocardioides litoris TaxID=1926648 RepID=UPI00111E801D|nr:ABC transporter permease [Nocardioides litoris]
MIRAALKSLLGRKVRLLMSTFAIVLGVAFVVGTLVFSDTLNRSFTALFASTVGDVVVAPEDAQTALGQSTKTIPAPLVAQLAELPGAARADGNVTAQGVYVLDPEGDVVGGSGPPGLGASYSDAPAAGGPGLQLVEGRAPQGSGEVVLDERTAERAEVGVGDPVLVQVPEGRPAQQRAQVVGLLGFPDGGSLNGATYVAWDTPTAQALFLGGQDAFTDAWVTARDGVSQTALADQARAVVPDGVEVQTGDDAADEQASQLLEAIGFLTTFLLIFAGIALVVGSFLVVNTFSMLVAQRSRELALLRALGASKRQVVRSVQVEALVLGAIGATLGIGLGVLLAVGLKALFASLGLDLTGQDLVYRPRTFVAAYAIGVLVTMAAAYLPARRTSRIAPVQAMRDDVALPESSLRRRFVLGLVLAVLGGGAMALGLGVAGDVPRAGWWIGGGILAVLLGVTAMSPVLAAPLLGLARAAYARAYGPVGNLAGQNSLRNPRRTAATASALMIGLTLACAMAIIGSSAKASVDQTVEDNFVGDYVVRGTGFGAFFNASVADQVAAVPGVREVVRQRFQLVDLDGDTEAVSALDPTRVGVFGLRTVAGDLGTLADRTVIVSADWADDGGYAVGEELRADPPSGEERWRIVGTYEDNPLVGDVVTTLATFEAGGYEPVDASLTVVADPGAGDLEEQLEQAVDNPTVVVNDQAEFAAEQREPINRFVYIIYALLGLALLIAVMGIVNTLALSVVERTREVGLLRAIGLTRGQLRWMITLESVVIAVLGAVLGVVLGVGFGLAMMAAVREQGLEVVDVPAGQLVVFLVLGVVIGVVAAVLPARRAARLDVLRAIATE